MSARPDDLGAGFDLALEEEGDSAAVARPLPREAVHVSVPSTDGGVSWILPGRGAPRETCGSFRTWYHRDGPKWDGPGRDKWNQRMSCGRFDCPKCYKDWAAREAGRIADRVMLGLGAHLRRVRLGKSARSSCGCVRQGKLDGDPFLSLGRWCVRGKDGRVAHWRWTRGRQEAVHVVIPPPPALWYMTATLDGYLTLRALAYAQAKAAGVDGACMVFHQYRLGDRWPNSRGGLCVDGPHWHAIGDAWTVPTREEDLATGKWAIWNKGVRKSVFATAHYLLTHAPRAVRSTGSLPNDNLHRPTQTVTWVGTWSYGCMKHPKPTKEGVPVVLCPVCKRMVPRTACFMAANGGTGPPDGDSGHAEGVVFRAVSFDCGGWDR